MTWGAPIRPIRRFSELKIDSLNSLPFLELLPSMHFKGVGFHDHSISNERFCVSLACGGARVETGAMLDLAEARFLGLRLLRLQ